MKKGGTTSQGQSAMPDLLTSFLLIAYGFVTWLTPNMDTFDSNGPKFLTFSLLNLLVFALLWLFARKSMGKDFLIRFFDTKIALSYGFLILFTLLSFVKAININESILHFSKVFTTFAGAWFMGVLVSRDKKAILPVAIALSFLLILDSFQTFSGISKLIHGKIANTGLIKASYSNKNILTSALFVKMPFALWLFYFQKDWKKYFGGVALFCGVLATFFMSSRAFYLGLVFVSLFLIVYGILKYRKTKEKFYVKTLLSYLALVGIAFIVFLTVQNTLYPKKVGGTFASRVESIASANNTSNKLRLTAWKCTATQMIPKDPLLGVGVGNWKLRFLEYENKYNPGYTYMYKNHNDFLEISAESGIFAGLAFLGLFVFAFLYLWLVVFKKPNEEQEKYFFLPALGLMAYAFDAFFNFPQDRPEIQSWFAMYVAIAAGLSLAFWGGDSPLLKSKLKGRSLFQIILTCLTALILLGATYVLVLNKMSLVLQRDVKEELNSGKLKSPLDKFVNGFPAIPDITILAEPIAVQKARFLLNEKKYTKTRETLWQDKSNPFDGRREYFIAMSYYKEKNYDSTMYYAKKALEVKPYFYNANTLVASILEKNGKLEKSIELWRNYLKGVKNKAEGWTVPVNLLNRLGRTKEAKALIDSAYHAMPNNKKILKLHTLISQKVEAGPHFDLYRKAVNLYEKQKYKEALPLFSNFIEKAPSFAKAYELRSICYYRQKSFKECIADIQKEEELGTELSANVINIKAAAYLMLGNKEKAKEYFLRAANKGDKDAINNYQKNFGKLPSNKKISFQVPTKK